MVTIERLISCQESHWQAVISLYENSFPAWEREPISAIEDNIAAGDSFCVIALENNSVVGAYICDVNRDLKFLLLSYVFVDEKQQGKGIGKLLCGHLKQYQEEQSATFNWLLLETEDFQYGFFFWARLSKA